MISSYFQYLDRTAHESHTGQTFLLVVDNPQFEPLLPREVLSVSLCSVWSTNLSDEVYSSQLCGNHEMQRDIRWCPVDIVARLRVGRGASPLFWLATQSMTSRWGVCL